MFFVAYWRKGILHLRLKRNSHKGAHVSGESRNGTRFRLPADSVNACVDFLLRGDNIGDVAFGTRKFKLDDGTEFTVPDWVR